MFLFIHTSNSLGSWWRIDLIDLCYLLANIYVTVHKLFLDVLLPHIRQLFQNLFLLFYFFDHILHFQFFFFNLLFLYLLFKLVPVTFLDVIFFYCFLACNLAYLHFVLAFVTGGVWVAAWGLDGEVVGEMIPHRIPATSGLFSKSLIHFDLFAQFSVFFDLQFLPLRISAFLFFNLLIQHFSVSISFFLSHLAGGVCQWGWVCGFYEVNLFHSNCWLRHFQMIVDALPISRASSYCDSWRCLSV